MNALKQLIAKKRPQIPLEAMISSRRIGLYKADPREIQKSLKGMQYLRFELKGNTDEDTQDYIGSIRMGGEIDIKRDNSTGEYIVYCDSFEIGRAAEGTFEQGILRGSSAFIQKIELNDGGIYIVTIAAKKPV